MIRRGEAMMSINKALKKEIVIKLLLFSVIICCAFVWNSLLGALRDGATDGDHYLKYIEQWTVTDQDGNSIEAYRVYNDERAMHEDFTISAVLPDDLPGGCLLCFLNRSDVEVYINGVLRKDFKRSRDVAIPGGSLKDFYIMVNLDESDSGASLVIKRYSTDWHPTVVPETFVISSDGLRPYLYDKYGSAFVMSIVLLVAASMVCIIALVMRIWYRQPMDVLYAALGIMDVALWLISVSQLTPFVTGIYYADGIMGFMLCMTMPFALLIYINSIQKGRYDNCFTILFYISFVSFVLWTILHFTGVQSFQTSLVYIDSVLAMSVVGVFATLILDIRNGHIKEYFYTALGFAAFLIMSIIEIIMLIFFELKSSELPMLIGLLCLLMFVVFQQVDDIRKVQSRLAVSEAESKSKSVFLSSMSHEIRTPINAVLGMDEMILRESHEDSTREYAENIKVAGTTLLGIINDVLDFSKIEAGKMEILPNEYDLASTLHDLVTMISIRAKKKGLDLITDISTDVPSRMYGDEIRIKQVFTNILTNAVKYTEKGSVTLALSWERADDEHIKLRVSVKDTGTGIKKEDIGKLFGAFERIDEGRNRNIEGTGLGMSITTRLLAMMGSELKVASEYGKGSDFSFEIVQKVVSWEPLGDYEKAWKESIKNNPVYSASFTAPDAKILAVDDIQMNLTVFAGLLKETRINVDTAGSGEECLDKLTREKYDIIFLDHRMPGMDGVETRKRMAELEGNLNSDTPVIALTANVAAGAKEEYVGYGFWDYLSKPINGQELEKMIADYLPDEKLERRQESDEQKGLSVTAGEYPKIDGLDWDYAILHLPDTALMRSVLSDFFDCIELHADRLEGIYAGLPDKDAMEAYRIQVHGMKSSAQIIGIVPLAGMAKILENAASNDDFETIASMNDIFIKEWRGYKQLLGGIMDDGVRDECSTDDFDVELAYGCLEIIDLAMQSFDLDRADEAMATLEAMPLPEAIRSGVLRLKALVSDVDDEGCSACIEDIKSEMGGL